VHSSKRQVKEGFQNGASPSLFRGSNSETLREGSYTEDSERHATEGSGNEALLIYRSSIRATYKHLAKDGSANMFMWPEPVLDEFSCYL
jgi:hypothetical protein